MRTGSFVYHNRPRWWIVIAAFVIGTLCGVGGALSWEQERELVQRTSYYPSTVALQASEGAIRHLTP